MESGEKRTIAATIPSPMMYLSGCLRSSKTGFTMVSNMNGHGQGEPPALLIASALRSKGAASTEQEHFRQVFIPRDVPECRQAFCSLGKPDSRLSMAFCRGRAI
jgi:hypothetical protein